jgi:hypothetical protein
MAIEPEDAGMTFGQRAVGYSFNPSGSGTVFHIKDKFAEAIDYLNDLRQEFDNPEIKRMLSIAITEAQTAQMWAVKAVTWDTK